MALASAITAKNIDNIGANVKKKKMTASASILQKFFKNCAKKWSLYDRYIMPAIQKDFLDQYKTS